MLKIFKKNQGNILLTVMIIMMIGGGLITYISQYNKLLNTYKNVFNQFQLLAKAEAKVKELISKTDPSCPLSATFKSFRNFSVDATDIVVTYNNLTPCIFNAGEASFFESGSITINEVGFNTNTLTRTVEMRSDFITKANVKMGILSRNVSASKTFEVRMMSLSNFNLMFLGGASPLIQLNGPGALNVNGSSFYTSSTNSIDIESIVDNFNPNVRLNQTFFVRGNSLSTSKSYVDNKKIQLIFAKGISSNSINSTFLDSFLPQNDAKWQYLTDQSTLQNYPFVALPKVATGLSVAFCADSAGFDSTKASYTNLPSAVSGITNLRKTCNNVTTIDPIPLLLHFRRNDNLTLNMDISNDNDILCGIIVAKKLTINLNETGKYGLFGNFIVDQLVINTGNNSTTLYIQNPEESGMTSLTLPPLQSLYTMQTEFKTVASTMAWNINLPVYNGSPFQPRTPDDFAKNCGGGKKSFNESVALPLQEITPLTKFSNIATNASDNAIILVQDVM